MIYYGPDLVIIITKVFQERGFTPVILDFHSTNSLAPFFKPKSLLGSIQTDVDYLLYQVNDALYRSPNASKVGKAR